MNLESLNIRFFEIIWNVKLVVSLCAYGTMIFPILDSFCLKLRIMDYMNNLKYKQGR